MKQWFNSLPRLIQIILLLIPGVNWVIELLVRWSHFTEKKGLLSPGATKPNKTASRSPEPITRKDDRTERERQYELEIETLKARIAYYESLESLQPFLKKTKKSEK